MKIEINNLQKICPLDTKRMKKLARSILKSEKKDAEINIAFVDNKRIKEINQQFLGHNYATDVLSFSYDESSFDTVISGEIVVSVEMALHVVKEDTDAVEGEVALYVVHGLLHLLGYNDKLKNDAKIMHQRAEELLLQHGYHISVPLP